MDRGGDPIGGREDLGRAYFAEYEDRGTWASSSETAKKRIKYYEGLMPADSAG